MKEHRIVVRDTDEHDAAARILVKHPAAGRDLCSLVHNTMTPTALQV